MRIALGLSYNGQNYEGWQSQAGGRTVQDQLEAALARFCNEPVRTRCAGRTDAGVHALMQVVHFDTERQRPPHAWVRGPNTFLPPDIAVQWVAQAAPEFHARGSAVARRYVYIVLESPVRPSIEAGRVGWTFRPLDGVAMRKAAVRFVGKHDFTSVRATSCQSASPIRTLHTVAITSRGSSGARYWRFDFQADAFLHHMIRNIMGCLIAVGRGDHRPEWIDEMLAARDRDAAAPTFSPAGLYFLGPVYDAHWGLPERTAAYDWLP